MLRRRRRAGAARTTSWPRIVTDPRSGVSSVAKIDSSVVLPAPFGPSTPTRAPRGTASETPLDLWPNEFWSEDGRLFVCSTHGALFEPDTGNCVAGPCAGDALTRLAIRRDGEDVVVSCPDA